MTVTLRPATSADEPFLWDMLYESLFTPPGAARPPRTALDEPQLAAYVTGFGTRPGDSGFVAEDAAGTPVGAVWARLRPAAQPGYGFVDADTPEVAIAIVAGQRGTGLGTRLVRAIQADRGRLSLSVDARNPAKRLYEREGFVAVTRDPGFPTLLYDPA